MGIKDIGIITITEKLQAIFVIDWLKFNDDELSDYLNRDLEYTDKGQIKSNTTKYHHGISKSTISQRRADNRRNNFL